VATGGTAEHRGRLIIGFAAETDHVAERARAKLTAKGADLIVANDVRRRVQDLMWTRTL